MKSSIYDNLGLFLILAIGAAFRLWGLTWALPLKKAHIDESVVIFYTMKFFTGDLNPHIFFDYPTLFLYILAFVYLVYFIAGSALGVFASLDQFVGIFMNGDSSDFYIIARLLSVFFAVASIYLVYRIGRDNFSYGHLPAFLLAIIPIHILHSHYATVDIASIFFVLLSFLFVLRYYGHKNVRDVYVGCFIMGLAAAVKYYPVVFMMPIMYAIYKNEKALFSKPTFFSLIFMASGFITGCPFSILDFPSFAARFIDRFKLIVWSPGSNMSFGFLGLFSSLLSSTTIVIFIFLAAGILVCFKYAKAEDKSKIAFILSFPVIYLLFLATWKIRSIHYTLPVLPFFILAGSYGFSLLPYLQKKRLLTYALVILLCTPAVVKDIRTGVILSKKDTRLAAYAWIKSNIPQGKTILRLPYTPEFTGKDPYKVRVDWESKIIKEPLSGLSSQYDYIITSSFDNFTVSEEETKILKEYKIINKWDHIPLAPFHDPRIIIYGKKI